MVVSLRVKTPLPQVIFADDYLWQRRGGAGDVDGVGTGGWIRGGFVRGWRGLAATGLALAALDDSLRDRVVQLHLKVDVRHRRPGVVPTEYHMFVSQRPFSAVSA